MDTGIVNAPLEQLRQADMPFGGYITETKDRDEFLQKNPFFSLQLHHLVNENKNKCRPIGLVDSANGNSV